MAPSRRDRESEGPGFTARETGEAGYHYSRRERLSLGSAPPPRPQGGFFRRNRHLLIILLDLLILVLLFAGVRAFLLGDQPRARLSGYQVTLRGFPYEDVVLASLSVKRLGGKAGDAFTLIRVRFLLESGGEAVSAEAALPGGAGEEIRIRRTIPAPAHSATLIAELVLSGAGAERRERLNVALEW